MAGCRWPAAPSGASTRRGSKRSPRRWTRRRHSFTSRRAPGCTSIARRSPGPRDRLTRALPGASARSPWTPSRVIASRPRAGQPASGIEIGPGGRSAVHASGLGLHPLYVQREGPATYFCTRIAPLADASPQPLTVDWEAWAAIFEIGCPLGAKTGFAEIERLEPGAWIEHGAAGRDRRRRQRRLELAGVRRRRARGRRRRHPRGGSRADRRRPPAPGARRRPARAVAGTRA